MSRSKCFRFVDNGVGNTFGRFNDKGHNRHKSNAWGKRHINKAHRRGAKRQIEATLHEEV